MSEFHRMITYLYLYEGSQKTHNVGYTKIEKRDTQYRVEIHMKNTGLNDRKLPVYFYTQNHSGFPGTLLGSVNFIRGTGEFKGLFEFADIAAVKGIFLPTSETNMILSQWDDTAFVRDSFLPAGSPDSSGNPPAPKPPVEPMHLKAAEAVPVPVSEESAVGSAVISSRWDFLLENFPSVAPFPSEDASRWVQLEVKDLKLLPKAYHSLGNNSFLLHGFFNYHHLILGEKEDTQPPQRFLGIPGIFQNPERVMAAIFGFSEFYSTSETDCKTGQFGYWILPLK